MVRPKHCRRVRFGPNCDYFKPRGIGLSELQVMDLNVEELEAIRLKDFEKLDQVDAAKKMNVSQPTFHRILLEARSKVADALVNGKAIKIHGGEFKMPGGDGTGPRGQGRGFGRGMGGRGRMGGPLSAGPEGVCKCSKCEYTKEHVRGQPCNQMKCPKCGAGMIRG